MLRPDMERDPRFKRMSNLERYQILLACTTHPSKLVADLLGDDPIAGLRACRWLKRLLEGAETHWVIAAYDSGQSWDRIGRLLGRSRQAVHMRYRRARGPSRWPES